MTIAARRHPAEILVEWAAPALLAAAAGWAAWRIGGSAMPALGSGVCALVIGLAAMRLLGTARQSEAEVGFAPIAFDDLLEEPGELLLDDPLVEIQSDARVVRLFARDEATPGELVARIADYLGEERRMPVKAAGEESASPPDASEALHAALANIRASLR